MNTKEISALMVESGNFPKVTAHNWYGFTYLCILSSACAYAEIITIRYLLYARARHAIAILQRNLP